MARQDRSEAELREKYGPEQYDMAQRLQPSSFGRRMALRDRLDQHFAKEWLDFTAEITRPRVLDDRTRFLVLTGQYTVTRHLVELEDNIRAALAAGVAPREVLEIILHASIFAGITVVDPALEVFERVADELGLLEEIEASQLPLDGRDRERSLEEERKSWHPDDVNDPRLQPLLDRYGWLGVSAGLRLRPKHHLDYLSFLDALDPEIAAAWLKKGYRGLYSRGIVDDRTRLLCMMANCIAVGEQSQAKAHMRGALSFGATPREVMHVIIQSGLNFGTPWMMSMLRMFVRLMADEGRLDEIGNPPVRQD